MADQWADFPIVDQGQNDQTDQWADFPVVQQPQGPGFNVIPDSPQAQLFDASPDLSYFDRILGGQLQDQTRQNLEVGQQRPPSEWQYHLDQLQAEQDQVPTESVSPIVPGPFDRVTQQRLPNQYASEFQQPADQQLGPVPQESRQPVYQNQVRQLEAQFHEGMSSIDDPQQREQFRQDMLDRFHEAGVDPINDPSLLELTNKQLFPLPPAVNSEDLVTLGVPKGAADVLAGLGKGAVNVLGFFNTLAGIGTLGLGALPKLAQKAVSAGFAAQMAVDSPQKFAELGRAVGEGRTEDAVRLAVEGGANVYLAGKSGEHALERTNQISRAVPETPPAQDFVAPVESQPSSLSQAIVERGALRRGTERPGLRGRPIPWTPEEQAARGAEIQSDLAVKQGQEQPTEVPNAIKEGQQQQNDQQQYSRDASQMAVDAANRQDQANIDAQSPENRNSSGLPDGGQVVLPPDLTGEEFDRARLEIYRRGEVPDEQSVGLEIQRLRQTDQAAQVQTQIPRPTPEQRELAKLNAQERLSTDEARQKAVLDQQVKQEQAGKPIGEVFPVGTKIEFNDPFSLKGNMGAPVKKTGEVTGYRVDPTTQQTALVLNGGKNVADFVIPGQVDARTIGYPKQAAFGKGQTKGETKVAFTAGQTREVINKANLPQNVKDAWNAWLDSPVMKKLDWSQTVLKFGPGQENFRASRERRGQGGDIFQFSENGQAADFAHEFFHKLYDVLPDNYKAAIEEARKAQLFEKYGKDVSSSMLGGRMTSAEFKAAFDKGLVKAEDYHLTNASEYLSTFAGNKFASDFFRDRHGKGFVQQIKDHFKAFWDATMRAIGRTPDKERIYREVVEGRFNPNVETGVIYDGRQGMFLTEPGDAAKAARLAKEKEGRYTEAIHALAQSTDILEFLKKFGIEGASQAAQKALGYFKFLGWNAEGETANGLVENYRSLKARMRNDHAKQTMSVVAGRQIAAYDRTLEDAVQQGTEAGASISTPQFLRKLNKVTDLKDAFDLADAINRAADPIFESEFRTAQKIFKEEARNDTEIARAEARLKEVDEARKSSSAMSQLVKDMINVVSASPEGQTLLANPDVRRQDLVRLYKDLKKSTDQPLHNEPLLNWASFILERNADLRDRLWAAELSRYSYIRSGMGAYGTKLAAELKNNLVGTVMRENRQAKKRQKIEDKAAFAYRALNKELMGELNKAGAKIEAGDIARQVMTDPEYRTFRKEVFADAKIEGAGGQGFDGSVKPYRNKVMVTPNGMTVDISPESLRGSKVVDQMWGHWDAAREDFHKWLNDPANQEDPNYKIHQRDLQTLEEYFQTENVLNPKDREQLMDGVATTILNAVTGAGGRLANSVVKTVARLNKIKEEAGNWRKNTVDKYREQRLKTMASHGLKHDKNGGKRTIEEVNAKLYEQHLNQLIYSLNRISGRPLKEGDKTLSGMTVTLQDLKDAALQSQAAANGWAIVEHRFGGEDFYVHDRLSGVTVQRRPSASTAWFVPRVFNDGLRQFVSDFAAARQEFAKANGDPVKESAATQKQINLLNTVWDQISHSFIWDRNPSFASETPFDGPTGAFEQLAREFESGTPNFANNFDGLIKELEVRSSLSPAEIRSTILAEWGRIIENLATKDEDIKLVQTPDTGARENSFTKGRGPELAPYAFYEYGFKDDSSVSRFAGTIFSGQFEKLAQGVAALIKDVDARIADLRTESGKTSKKEAISARALEVKNGTNFDRFESLKRKKARLEDVLNNLISPDPANADQISWARLFGGVTGQLVSQASTTVRNLTSNVYYLGKLGMRMNGTGMQEYPIALFHLMLDQGVKGLISGGIGVAKGAYSTIPGMYKAVREMSQNKGRRTRHFFGTTFRDMMTELGQGMIERNKTMQELQRRGLDFTPDAGREWENRIGAGLMNAGQIMSEAPESSRAMAAVSVPFELLGTPLRAILSVLGERSANAGGFNYLLRGPFSHKQRIQRALDRVVDNVQASGYRTFNLDSLVDPANRLSDKEMLPQGLRGLLNTIHDLPAMESVYRDAGLSFQTEAMKYVKARLEGDDRAKFLTGDAEDLLANHFLALFNKSTPTGKPIAFEDPKFLNQLAKPLLGWRVRTLNTMLEQLSVPSYSPEVSRAKRLLLVATFMALPAFLMGAATSVLDEKTARLLRLYWQGQESSTKLPWDYETTKGQVSAAIKSLTYGIPIIDMLANGLLADQAARASLDPSLVMVEKFKDLMGYAKGAYQTGDLSFGLPRLINGFVPDAKVILNRVKSQAGHRLGDDVVALLRQHGPTDIVKGIVASSYANYTPLSPYAQRMENAALNGDLQLFKQIYQEALAKARQVGRTEPEQAVKQIFMARNPFTRGLTQKMTDQQYRTFIGQLDDSQRAKVELAWQRFNQAAELIGANPTLIKQKSGLGQVFRGSAPARSGRGGMRGTPVNRGAVRQGAR